MGQCGISYANKKMHSPVAACILKLTSLLALTEKLTFMIVAVWGESLFTVCFSVLLCFHRQLFSSSVLGSSFLSLLPPRFFSGPGTLVMLSNRDDQPPLKPHPKPSPPPPPLQLSHQPLPTTIILCTSNCSLSSISHPSFTLLRPSPNAYILSSARQYWILPVPLWI